MYDKNKDRDIGELEDMTKNNLYRYRKAKYLTQKNLADKVGLSVVAISNIERGAVDPRPSTKRSIAEALGIPIADVFPITEEDVPARVLATAS